MKFSPFLLVVSIVAAMMSTASAFTLLPTTSSVNEHSTRSTAVYIMTSDNEPCNARRSCVAAIGASFLALPANAEQQSTSFLQDYDDFTKTKEGWSYRDVKDGKGGTTVQPGDRVVYDWSGYTIGYFGRPFQAKGYVLLHQ